MNFLIIVIFTQHMLTTQCFLCETAINQKYNAWFWCLFYIFWYKKLRLTKSEVADIGVLDRVKNNEKSFHKKMLWHNWFPVLPSVLSLKCKTFAVWLVETACIFFIFLIATVQISMEFETQENVWIYTNLKKYICRYRINQHSIVLKLNSASVNKILDPEFVTSKVSQDLNLM